MARSVVIVEDHVPLRQTIARNLARRGLQVQEAGTAADGLQAIKDLRPDLLLLDIGLPDQSGWDVMRNLSQHALAVPTIVMSAAPISPHQLEEFHPLAALIKPFRIEALLGLVLGSPQRSEAAT